MDRLTARDAASGLAGHRDDAVDAERRQIEKDLWEALLVKGREIRDENSLRESFRGRGMVSGHRTHPSQLAMSVKFEFSRSTDTGELINYLITAHQGHDQVQFRVERWITWSEDFWRGQLSNRSNAVVIDGRHYRIQPDHPKERQHMAGFGGAKSVIKFHDGGRTVETRNLWYQGVIPPQMRHLFPDTAAFKNENSPPSPGAQVRSESDPHPTATALLDLSEALLKHRDSLPRSRSPLGDSRRDGIEEAAAMAREMAYNVAADQHQPAPAVPGA